MRPESSRPSWTGPGCPYWYGPPHQDRIRRILSLTTPPDSKGRQYYSPVVGGGLRRLQTLTDYKILNSALDFYK